jgi:hypothetical protein
MRSANLALVFATSAIGFASEANAIVYCAWASTMPAAWRARLSEIAPFVVAPACRTVNGLRICR